MATVCAASPSQTIVLSSSFHTGSSCARLKSCAGLAVPHRQNGNVKVSASAEERCSRREAMAVVGGAGLAGLLFLLPAGSAEAISGLPRSKPESRKKIREEIDKVREEAVKLTEGVKKNVQGGVKEVSNKVANK